MQCFKDAGLRLLNTSLAKALTLFNSFLKNPKAVL